MNIPKINQNETSFNGRAIARTSSYGLNKQKLPKITKQINNIRIVKNGEANVYLCSAVYENFVSVVAQKGKFNPSKAYQTEIKTVVNAEAIVSATKRSLAKYKKVKDIKDEPVRPKPQKIIEKDTSGEPYYPFLTRIEKLKLYLKKKFNIK